MSSAIPFPIENPPKPKFSLSEKDLPEPVEIPSAVSARRVMAAVLVSLAVHVFAMAWLDSPTTPPAIDALQTVRLVTLPSPPTIEQSPSQPAKITPAARPAPPAPVDKTITPETPPPKPTAKKALPKPKPTLDPVPNVPPPAEDTSGVSDTTATATPPAVAPGPPAELEQTRAAEAPAQAENRPIDLAAAYRENPLPPYPSAARRFGWEGVVMLSVVVDAQGKPIRVEIEESSGRSVLDRTALRAVRQWRFRPATVDGRARQSTVRVPIQFRLETG